MANNKQALKRVRQNDKRRTRNRRVLTTFRGQVKQVRAALASSDLGAARDALKEATRALDWAASKGVIHPNQASRKISRLTRAVNALAAQQ